MDSRFFEIFKFALLVCILLIAAALFAEESTIIDTIWTENILQSAIGYHVQNGTYWGGIIQPDFYSFAVGDSYDFMYDFNDIAMRAYFSFPIQPVPVDCYIDSVCIFVFQGLCVGNDQVYEYPIWFDNQNYPCNLYHVDYGLTFEPADFNPEIYDTLGVISSDSNWGWKRLNITNAYIADMVANRQYTQLMFKFFILTDYDCQEDYVEFASSYSGNESINLKIYYSRQTINIDEEISTANILTIYPNPCKNGITVETKGKFQVLSIDIYNLKGQKVFAEDQNIHGKNKSQLDLWHLNLKDGIYLLSIKTLKDNKISTYSKKITILK